MPYKPGVKHNSPLKLLILNQPPINYIWSLLSAHLPKKLWFVKYACHFPSNRIPKTCVFKLFTRITTQGLLHENHQHQKPTMFSQVKSRETTQKSLETYRIQVFQLDRWELRGASRLLHMELDGGLDGVGCKNMLLLSPQRITLSKKC